MSSQVECPGCRKRYKVGDDLAGKQVRCGCGKMLVVPKAAGNDRASQERAAAGKIPDDLLDETIWDAEPTGQTPLGTLEPETEADRPPVVGTAPVAAVVVDTPAQPTAIDETATDERATDETEYEPDTFWDRFKSPSPLVIAWLAIAYGAGMTLLLLAMTVLTGFGYYCIVGFAMTVSTAVGGVLILRRHPLGPSCAGLASTAIGFSWLWSLLWSFPPIHMFLLIFALQFPFFYAPPAYIVYWCLKEEGTVDEAAEREDFYAIRDTLVERAIEENQKEWKSKS
jgi:hypothetical protein